MNRALEYKLIELKKAGFLIPDAELADQLDPDLWFWQPATERQVRYVYWLGSRAGYHGDDVHEWHPSHMTKGQIEELIQRLQIEAGVPEDNDQRRKRFERDRIW